MTWTNPPFSLGTIVAVIVLVAGCLLAFMGQLGAEWLLLIAAVSAARL